MGAPLGRTGQAQPLGQPSCFPRREGAPPPAMLRTHSTTQGTAAFLNVLEGSGVRNTVPWPPTLLFCAVCPRHLPGVPSLVPVLCLHLAWPGKLLSSLPGPRWCPEKSCLFFLSKPPGIRLPCLGPPGLEDEGAPPTLLMESPPTRSATPVPPEIPASFMQPLKEAGRCLDWVTYSLFFY